MPERLNHSNTESTVAGSIRPAKRWAFGWSSKAMLGQFTMAISRVNETQPPEDRPRGGCAAPWTSKTHHHERPVQRHPRQTGQIGGT